MSAATIAQGEFIAQLVRYLGLDASKYRTGDFDKASAMIGDLKAYREHHWRGLAITDGTRQAVQMRMREQGVTKDDVYPVAGVVSLGRQGGATESQGQALLRHLAGEEVHQEARDPNPPRRTIASIPPEVRRRMRPGLLQRMLAVEVKPPPPPEPVVSVVNPKPVATNPHGTVARPVGRAVRGRPGVVAGASVAAPVVQAKAPEPLEPDDLSFRDGCFRTSGRAGAEPGGETGDHASRAAPADGAGGLLGLHPDQTSGPLDPHARRLDPAALLDPLVAAIMATYPGSTILEIDPPCS